MSAPSDPVANKLFRERCRVGHLKRLGDPAVRFWAKVLKTDNCWEWQGAKFSHGYGQFKIQGKVWQVHRLAYTLSVGPIPDGMLICHHCDNKICARPSHLFAGTNGDNQRDSVRKGRAGFVLHNPMKDAAIVEKVISQKRGVPRPYMKRGDDGKFIGTI